MIMPETEKAAAVPPETDADDGPDADVPLRGVFRPWMIIIGLIILAAYQFHFINFTWDDPFITWRYAENFAQGKGLVFNEGERVEGYSNLLYVLIFALFYKLHIYWGELRLLYPAKIIGSLTSLALIWLTVRYAAKLDSFRRLRYPKAAVVIGFLAVSNIFLHIWAMCGMETIFFPFLVLLGNIFLISGIEAEGSERRKRFYQAGFIYFLATITRPDGFIMVGSAFLFVVMSIREKRLSFYDVLGIFITWLIPSLAVLAWRYSYYGELMPMSYFSKASGGWEKIRAGTFQWKFGATQILGHWFLYALMYLPIITRRGRVGPAYFLLFCQTLFYQVYIIYSGFDFLWGNRFFTHMLPMLELMLFAGICEIFYFDRSFRISSNERANYEMSRRLTIALVLVILAMFGISGNAGFYKLQHWDFKSGFLTGLKPDWMLPAYYDTGMYMKRNLEPTDLVAIGDIGAIPYISGVRVLDCFGLTDKYTAKLPGDFFFKKYDIDYILGESPYNSRKPDYIVLMGHLYHRGQDNIIFHPSADKFLYMVALWADQRFHDDYELVDEVDFFLIFKHKDLGRGPEQSEGIKRWYERGQHNTF